MLCPSLQTMALFLCLQTSRSSLKKRGMILQGCLLFIFTQNKLLCLLVWACIQCTMCMRTAMQMVVYTNFFKMPSWAGQPQLITEDDINVHIYLVPHILITESQYPVHTRALTVLLWFLVTWASSPPLWVLRPWCLYFNNLVGITKCWTYLEEGACITTILALSLIFKLLSWPKLWLSKVKSNGPVSSMRLDSAPVHEVWMNKLE